MENLLYYPYINIPKTDWTVRTLLYYDTIGCIVPQRYFYEPEKHEPFMLELVKQELITPINPIETLENPWEVSRPFIDYVKSPEFELEHRANLFNEGDMATSGAKIHADKFDRNIFYELEQAGLARKKNQEEWFVEKQTANEMMTFLASVIAGKLMYLPTTDSYRKEFSLISSDSNTNDEQTKREIILNELIPYPEQVDIGKLRAFKDKHIHLLKSFKNKIEILVLNQDADSTSPAFTESLNELIIRKSELAAKMNESKLGSIFFGTICGISSAAIGLTTANTDMQLITGLTTFASAVYTGLQIEKSEGVFDQSGMKYIALLDKKISKTS